MLHASPVLVVLYSLGSNGLRGLGRDLMGVGCLCLGGVRRIGTGTPGCVGLIK